MKIQKLTNLILLAVTMAMLVLTLCVPNIVNAAKDINALLPGSNQATSSVEANLVKNLPKADSWTLVIAKAIQLMLQITGGLAVLSFTWGGVDMITAQGNEEKIKKGRNIILWSLLALVIIAISYAIVTGISQLQFFA